MSQFNLKSDFRPSGDQPEAIDALVEGLNRGLRDQILLGVTGSGKTFTMAQVIARSGKPTLIMAQNKTLAAQLYGEMKAFFPDNAVEYFVSYYDYYQPEAYVPRSDTYIEKESSINEHIDRLRHSATISLLERRDVVVVASVSCLFGIGSAEFYRDMTLRLETGKRYEPHALTAKLTELQYGHAKYDLERGKFRLRGEVLEVFPSHLDDAAWRISFFDDEVENISAFDPLTGEKSGVRDSVTIYPNSHYVTPRPTVLRAITGIKADLKKRIAEFKAEGKAIEAQRIEERTLFDLEMLEISGGCPGIENYSRYLTGRKPGEPPPTLIEYLHDDALIIVDESHVSVPQIRGMYRGDRVRKETLYRYGFRLPSCVDNRPLAFEEWDAMRPQTIYVSATPGDWEIERTDGRMVQQLIRPTGLIEPEIAIEPVAYQVEDVIARTIKKTAQGHRVLITTLTKRMAEDLTEYLSARGLKVRYLHSDVDTVERMVLIRDLRRGVFDVLVGINLLREGLDIPECALVAVLDADKEGFLRSRTSLIQTCGRAARNVEGEVVFYADTVTDSIRKCLEECDRRREYQKKYNEGHGIVPATIKSEIRNVAESVYESRGGVGKAIDAKGDRPDEKLEGLTVGDLTSIIRKKMLQCAEELDFETAAMLRDQLSGLELLEPELPANAAPLTNEAIEASLGTPGSRPDKRDAAKLSARAAAKSKARRVAQARARHRARIRKAR